MQKDKLNKLDDKEHSEFKMVGLKIISQDEHQNYVLINIYYKYLNNYKASLLSCFTIRLT